MYLQVISIAAAMLAALWVVTSEYTLDVCTAKMCAFSNATWPKEQQHLGPQVIEPIQCVLVVVLYVFRRCVWE